MMDMVSGATKAVVERGLKDYIDQTLAGAGALKGIGVEKTEIVDGHLIVTYDNGSTEDAGELPVNPNVVNVLDFGAVGDGTTEDTTAVKSAFEEAVESGKPLYIPEGEFLIDWGKISLDLGEKGLVVFGDGRTKSIIKLKDSQNGGNGGSGIALRNTDSTIAPNVSISNIGMVYENNDDTALIYSGQARQINMLGYFGEVSIDNSYFHLGGTAETLPQDSCLFWQLGADTITITNCLFENFTNREVGGCAWVMPSDAENTYSIGQVIIKNNEFRNTNKDEAVAVYTSLADTENNVHNIVISGNVIAHKSWNSTQGNCSYTDGLISVLIANTSSPKNDGNVVISDNNLYSELASQEIIRITRFKGVEVRNNKLTVTAKNGSSNLRTIRFIQSDGVIKDNVLDYTAITENEVQADDGSNSKVSWESNRFMLGTGGGINPSSNTTFVFKGNVVDIPNNKKFAIRKNQSTNTVEVYDNTINGNLSMGALNGSGLVIKGNRFNANVATTNIVDVSGGTGAYLDYQGNDGVVLQFKTGNVQTPISKFTYVGRKGQLKFLSGSTPLDDSSETRALFFSTADIVYTDKQVEANPTLVGTEPVLDGLEINGQKFAVPSGGGSGSDAFDKALVNAKRSLVTNKGTMLFAFDASKEGLSGQTSTASVKNDYSIFKNNSHSCLIYSEDTTKRVVDTFFSFPEETFGENTYGFWIYIPTVADLNALNYIQIDAGSVNQHGQLSGSQKIWQYYATSLNVGWNYCPFNQEHTLTVFSGLRIRFVDVNGSSATEFHEKHVYFDSIVKNYAMKPCVLLAFDNSADSNMYSVAYAEAKARGIVGTFSYQGGDNPDGEGVHKTGVTREHLNEMLAEGWDVAQYDGFNMEQDIDDIKAYNEFLKGQGLEMTAYFPRLNAITEDIWNALAEMGFKLARTANSLNVVSADNLDVIQSYGFNYTNTASVTLGKINDAISANQSMCILIHKVLTESDGTQSNCLLSEYQTFLDGLKALRDNGTIYIVTFKEYYYDSLMKSVVDKFA